MPVRIVGALAAFALLSGCGRALGPERMETASVRGRVHFRDVPIASGWIEFVPTEGTMGRLRSAKLAADGSFDARAVPVGRVAIRLAGPPLPRSGDPGIDNFFFMCRQSFLMRRNVSEGGAAIDIELRDEATAFEKVYGPRR